jgi:4-diphosphocytidyl-2C-methyl-D-erythritol kinase
VFSAHPEVERAKDALQATKPLLVSLSGSGSALFAVYPDEGRARRALAQLRIVGGSTFLLTHTRRSMPLLKLL